MLLSATLAVLFPFILYTLKNGYYDFLICFAPAFVAITLIPLIPKTKKQKLQLTPKRIFTDGETLTCVGENYTESMLIGDEKEVRDYGEFYVLVYPFGKVSEKFVCQKKLLTKGSLEEFEALFEGKIKKY